MSLEVGIIGLGRQTVEEHIPALNLIANISVKAICDIKKDRIIEAKINLKNNHSIKEYTSFKDMLCENRFDFIIVGLPHDQYIDCIKLAAEKKVDILKEKPFARNIDEANAIFNLIEQYDVRLMTACQRRFHPLYKEFKDLIPTLGRIKWIEARYTIPSKNPNSEWRSSKEKAGGGVMLDMGYHIFDILMWFFEPLVEVYAITLNHRPNIYSVEDTAFIRFKTHKKNEPDCLIDGSIFISCIYPEKLDELIILGEKGSAKLNSKEYTFWNNAHIVKANNKFEAVDRWLEASKEQIDEFCEAHGDRGWKKYFGNPHFQMMHHVPLFEALYNSADTHQPVKING
jgi:predicted dehydrogenase